MGETRRMANERTNEISVDAVATELLTLFGVGGCLARHLSLPIAPWSAETEWVRNGSQSLGAQVKGGAPQPLTRAGRSRHAGSQKLAPLLCGTTNKKNTDK